MDGLYKKAGSTFFLKVFGLGVAFIFQIILGRMLEPASYGEYTMYLTYSSIFTIIAVFGMDQNLIKEIAKNKNDRQQSNSFLQLSMAISTILIIVLSVIVLFLKDKLGFSADGIYLFIAMSVIRTVVMIFDGFLQGNGFVVKVTILNDVINNILKVILFITLVMGGISSLKAALWSFIFSEFIMGFIRLLSINRILGNKYKLVIGLEKKVKNEFIKYSSTVLFVSGIGILLQNVDRIMISSYLDLVNVGIYKVSQNYVALIGVFISPFIAFWPIISKLYHENKLFEIQEEMKKIVKIVTYLVIPMFFIFVFQSGNLLSIFGEFYATGTGKKVLVILAFSFLVDAISGPIGSILTMTNYAKFILYNSIASLVVNVILNYLLIGKYGIVGVAVATGVSIILNNILSILEVKILLGIFSYDFKNVLQIILLSIVNWGIGGGLSKVINIDSHILQIIVYGVLIYLINMIIITYVYRKEIHVFLGERGKK
ncbi:flippase [Enterococcus sp. LJL98]